MESIEGMELTIRGIRCDACDYIDEDVKYEEYPDYVNKPCPECGESLLTQEAYDTLQFIIAAAKEAQKLADELEGPDDKMMAKVSMNIGKDGDILDYKIDKLENEQETERVAIEDESISETARRNENGTDDKES